ncbi:hypothetical protein ACJU26_05830 [Acidithiobacillus sp. M4-SHS-6]|uniref:hypothetical protein n=1 Tax=Acidithiobacillus sp. M4-SHS-6 TaxID=3383024 RepID=UPI0039BDC2D2
MNTNATKKDMRVKQRIQALLTVSLMLASHAAWATKMPTDASPKIKNVAWLNFTRNYLQGSWLDDWHIALAIICLLMPLVVMRTYFSKHPDISANDRKISYGLSMFLECSLIALLIASSLGFIPISYAFVEVFWIFMARLLSGMIKSVNPVEPASVDPEKNITMFSSAWWEAVYRMKDSEKNLVVIMVNFIYAITMGVAIWISFATESQMQGISWAMLPVYVFAVYAITRTN